MNVLLFANNQKLYSFGPRYKLQKKYNILIPSYNLQRENYEDKSILQWSNFEGEVTRLGSCYALNLPCEISLLDCGD